MHNKHVQQRTHSAEQHHLTHPNYRPDIDGLRAIAILSVIGFHAFPNWVKGGYVGVDIFFVISGYLISTIIVGSMERNSFSFVEFYIRRINRIFPALLLVLIVCFVFGWFTLLADEYKQLGKHIAGGAGFVSNYLFWNESGYFDNAAETKPLLHLWSLGIEEQFYIAWPLMLWFAWKQRLNLLTITIVVLLISFTLNISKIGSDEVSVFYSPLTRFWELLVGSVIAYLTLHKKYFSEANGSTLRNIQSLFGAALITVGVFYITKEKAFPGWWAIYPTSGTLLIISAGKQAWLNRVVLSNHLLVWFGLISYPLYLWHWPLLSFARIMESDIPSHGIRIAAILIAVVLAWLTYKLVEIPIRFGKHGKSKTITLLALMVFIGGVGYYCFKRDGLEFRLKWLTLNTSQFIWNFTSNDNCLKLNADFAGGGNHCARGKVSPDPTIVLLGDSHSNALYPGMAELTINTAENVLNIAYGGCLPFFDTATIQRGATDGCVAFTNRALLYAGEHKSVRTIVMSSRGPLYLSGKGFNEPPPGHDIKLLRTKEIGVNVFPEFSDSRPVFVTAMRETIEYLLSKNKKIIFVLDVPELGFDPKSCVESRPLRLVSRIKHQCTISRQEFNERNREYRELVFSVLKDFPSVQQVDAANLFCDTKQCWAMKGGMLLYRDDGHLSLEGSRLVAKEIAKLILQQ